MKTVDTSKDALISQRKRFEALGNALKKASSMTSWFKVMFACTLIFGIPTLILLSNPLKDSTTFTIEFLVFGSRILMIALALFLLARITPQIYTAKNDFKMKFEEVGYQQADSNTKEEQKFVLKNMFYSILKILVFIAAGFGLFLVSSRVNYGYIIGQQALYLAVLVILAMTFTFWSNSKPDYSPRLGGRLIVLSFVPATYFWTLEIIIGFFRIISEPNLRYNYTQSSYGFVYPFVFLFLVIVVLITTKKTIREKTTLQEAREEEFQRVSTFIEEKNFLRRAKYKYDIWWNQLTQKISPKSKDRDIDKKPNIILVNSLWISLFVTVLIFAFVIPWNMFPQDAMLFVSVLMISFQYSMIKYERDEIEVLSEPVRNEEIEPPSIRTKELPVVSLRIILLPTVIFIIAQYIMSGVLSSGLFTTDNKMTIMLFTWISALIVVPTSLQLIFLISKNMKTNRELKNVKMYLTSFIYLLGFELLLYIITVISLFAALQYNFQLIDPSALILQAVIVLVMLIIPIAFILISLKVDDKGFRILRICTWVLIALINLVIVEEFLHFVISGYFLVQWPW